MRGVARLTVAIAVIPRTLDGMNTSLARDYVQYVGDYVLVNFGLSRWFRVGNPVSRILVSRSFSTSDAYLVSLNSACRPRSLPRGQDGADRWTRGDCKGAVVCLYAQAFWVVDHVRRRDARNCACMLHDAVRVLVRVICAGVECDVVVLRTCVCLPR